MYVKFAQARTTDTQREFFFQKLETFGLGQTNWAEIYEAYGVFLAKLLRWQPEKKQGFIR